MRKEYDFSKMKVTRRGALVDRATGKRIPPKIRVSINLDGDVIEHFKALAAKPVAMPYQTQINQALRKCLEVVEEPAAKYSIAAVRDALLADESFVNEVAKRAKRR
jgi:uncharacterized protein (DUF4415 family)